MKHSKGWQYIYLYIYIAIYNLYYNIFQRFSGSKNSVQLK